MKKKLIYFSEQQITRVQRDANLREISFTEMVRRILDRHYEIDKTLNSKESEYYGRKQRTSNPKD